MIMVISPHRSVESLQLSLASDNLWMALGRGFMGEMRRTALAYPTTLFTTKGDSFKDFFCVACMDAQ